MPVEASFTIPGDLPPIPSPVGTVLVVDPGTVTGAHTITTQWLRNGAPIEGATSVVYTTVTADAGATISCRVTATGAGGTISESSNSFTIASGS